MIVVMNSDVTQHQIDEVVDRIRSLGLVPHIMRGKERTIVGAIGDDRLLHQQPFTAFSGVESVLPILAPWKLVSRECKAENTEVHVDGTIIGGTQITIMAGPCAVESGN